MGESQIFGEVGESKICPLRILSREGWSKNLEVGGFEEVGGGQQILVDVDLVQMVVNKLVVVVVVSGGGGGVCVCVCVCVCVLWFRKGNSCQD